MPEPGAGTDRHVRQGRGWERNEGGDGQGRAMVLHPALRRWPADGASAPASSNPALPKLGPEAAGGEGFRDAEGPSESGRRESWGRRSPDARLEEAIGLAAAINLNVVIGDVISLQRPKAGSFFGEGVVAELAEWVAAEDIDLAVIDTALSPVQQRNLEKSWQCKVIDRTGLILEIFGERARTREGQMQVELAALTYQRSRLVRSWTHLERQRGGLGFVGGPGESQLELDRRLIGERIAKLRRSLDDVKRTRQLHRSSRKKVPFPIVALVGYTNAGKSTLFNRLTNAEVYAADLLFATLDPTLRKIALPSGRSVLLSDTVGFLSELPTQLVAAFRATLEEVREADLIVHVRDMSHPDRAAQKADVEAVLADLGLTPGADDRPFLELWNKIDRLDDEERAHLGHLAQRSDRAVLVSAASGEGVEAVMRRLEEALGEQRTLVTLDVDYADGATLAWLYRHGEVVARRDLDHGIALQVGFDDANLSRWQRRCDQGGPDDDTGAAGESLI